MKTKLLPLLASALVVLGLAACQKSSDTKGPAERAGQKVDEAAVKTADKIDEVASKVGEKMQEAGRNIQQKAEDAKK